MKSISILLFLFVSLFLSAPASVLADEVSQPVKIAEVPEAVQRMIHSKAGHGDGKLGQIFKITDDGEISYEVVLVKGKERRKFSVGADGSLLSWQVFPHELPEAARASVNTEVAALKAHLGQIDRVVDAGKTNYEVNVTCEPREFSFTISETGRLLFLDVTFEEIPFAAQEAIKTKAAGGVVTSMERNSEEEGDPACYDVEYQLDGKTISFSVDENGGVLEDE